MIAEEYIRAGRDQLFERGWTQGMLKDEEGHVCAAGALWEVAKSVGILSSEGLATTSIGWDEYHRAHAALVEATGLPDPGEVFGCMFPGSIATFNDVSGRTFDEVIDLYNKAEKILQEENT